MTESVETLVRGGYNRWVDGQPSKTVCVKRVQTGCCSGNVKQAYHWRVKAAGSEWLRCAIESNTVNAQACIRPKEHIQKVLLVELSDEPSVSSICTQAGPGPTCSRNCNKTPQMNTRRPPGQKKYLATLVPLDALGPALYFLFQTRRALNATGQAAQLGN